MPHLRLLEIEVRSCQAIRLDAQQETGGIQGELESSLGAHYLVLGSGKAQRQRPTGDRTFVDMSGDSRVLLKPREIG